MIRTATQLKAKVRNLSGGDSKKAQTLIRNFIMERIALSQYRNNFILKGGMLVAAVGQDGYLHRGCHYSKSSRIFLSPDV